MSLETKWNLWSIYWWDSKRASTTSPLLQRMGSEEKLGNRYYPAEWWFCHGGAGVEIKENEVGSLISVLVEENTNLYTSEGNRSLPDLRTINLCASP